MEKIKPGDFVRLTDPISNGEIVRIETVDEYGVASWVGGSQAANNMEQVNVFTFLADLQPLVNTDKTLSDVCRWIETRTGVKLYPESEVEVWKRRAHLEEKEHVFYEKAWNKMYNKCEKLQDALRQAGDNGCVRAGGHRAIFN